jgi:hypothetical protein
MHHFNSRIIKVILPVIMDRATLLAITGLDIRRDRE